MEFRNLKRQYKLLKKSIDQVIENTCVSADFIAGNEVKKLEQELAKYVGVKHCVTCANGTDALTIALKVWGIGEKDAVFVPDFSFFSTAESPAGEGATCVFVDVDEQTYNINPIELEKAIIKVKDEKEYNPRVVIAVDLFGQPADYDKIKNICRKYDLLLLEDGAQGFGGMIRNRRACSFGDISITSFFPAKPLGCYGDGGALFTDNDDWVDLIRSYTVHGKNKDDKYDNIRIGMNSRLDTIQAAILRVKFMAFVEYELENINKIASMYREQLKDLELGLPIIDNDNMSSWAQFTIRLPENVDRDSLREALLKKKIPTMIYYKKQLHMQGAFIDKDIIVMKCSNSKKLCNTVISLPIDPYMKEDEVKYVVDNLRIELNRFTTYMEGKYDE